MSTRLFVGGLPWETTEDQLRQLFAEAGTVVSATIVMDKFTQRPKGFGFVEMSTPEEAKAAIEKINGKLLGDRTIKVDEARPREERPGGYSNR